MAAKKPRKRPVIDEQAARELDLYAENTSELYGQFKSIIANIKRKIKGGRYSPTLAPKLWLYWYDAAAKRYAKEFADPKDWARLFPKVLREHLAAERAVAEFEMIRNGEYN